MYFSFFTRWDGEVKESGKKVTSVKEFAVQSVYRF